MYEVTTKSAPGYRLGESSPRAAPVSEIATTVRSGVNRAASAAQFGTTQVGATIRNGGASGFGCRAWPISASDCEGLAQSHVVGEDAAEPVGPQERQPLESLELVRP